MLEGAVGTNRQQWQTMGECGTIWASSQLVWPAYNCPRRTKLPRTGIYYVPVTLRATSSFLANT